MIIWGNLGTSSNTYALDYNVYFKDKKVKQVSCGATHCALLTSRSEIWTWGCGDGGYKY